ncbi:phenazine antibiotic biosynthesis protein [Nocardia sp. alder85J]|uniref:phenazine antibiotic biosynthesis protein n=1 Tax=Nocardia sp. alder85J TaxID=2862949 RepID=UPI0022500C07|nr:phenazine antibiotic biosynthesis protein [Nocardia sp. alder85J]MCX4092560.1 phenazine antibiotic biosynthesis protein [Nocardia sp. alder85J]
MRELMQWHFRPETGTPYWLRRRAALDFDPLTDIRGIDDLARFPNVADELRDVPVQDLIPRGLGPNPEIAGVYESGGTTGAPKRLPLFEDWLDAEVRWEDWAAGLPAGGPVNILAVTPSGPHIIGECATRGARRTGGVKFAIDLDPRWVKLLVSQNKTGEVADYIEHILAQAAHILASQRVDMLFITPPLLTVLAARTELVQLINKTVRVIRHGGARMNPANLEFYRAELFPGIVVRGMYGSTTILGAGKERLNENCDGASIYDAFSPYFFYRVVNPADGTDVEFGERGRVVMNHITKYLLLPNNLERDTAYRIEPPPGTVGCSVADIEPVAVFGGQRVIEGVY